MALRAQSPAAAPSPVHPGAGRSSVPWRDPGRATELLYRRHGDTVFRYAWHLLGRREDAEDATQATFLAVHRALGGGTAVLDPSAWVLRIARNECMGRLRQSARRPATRSLDDGFDPPAAGGVERSAELRDEMRTARETLGGLPVPEREAFVMREWLGLEAGEAGRALGLSAGDVDGLASRARRSLVLAVGGLEPAIGCAGTRTALEAGSLDRAAKVHLLRCPVCRGVRRALRPPEGSARPAVAERLSAAIPGFTSGGGGILAALTAKAAAAPVLAKTAAIVAAAVATGGAVEQAIVRTQPAHGSKPRGGQAQALSQAAPALSPRSGRTVVAYVAPPRTTPGEGTTRGAAATPAGGHRTGGEERGGRASQRDDGGDNSGPGTGAESGAGRLTAGGGSRSGSDDGSSGDAGASSLKAGSSGGDGDSGSATTRGDDGAEHGDSGSGNGSAGVIAVPTTSGDSGGGASSDDSASGGAHGGEQDGGSGPGSSATTGD